MLAGGGGGGGELPPACGELGEGLYVGDTVGVSGGELPPACGELGVGLYVGDVPVGVSGGVLGLFAGVDAGGASSGLVVGEVWSFVVGVRPITPSGLLDVGAGVGEGVGVGDSTGVELSPGGA